jgi:hypothetical protein
MTETKLVLSGSEVKALEIAADELDSYIGVMREDIKEVQDETQLEKLEWASKKIRGLLAAPRW